MNDPAASRRVSALWIMMLTLASTATTLVFACATPFPALAALAAVHMGRRDGVALAVAAWVASQVVGFGLLGYPTDPSTMVWGGAVGVAAVIGALAADRAATAIASPVAVRLAAAYLGAFVAFKLVILAVTLVKGDPCTAFTVEILGRQLLRNAMVLTGLYILYQSLLTIGVPSARRALAAA